MKVAGNENALVLDSFAGSGTTAHAVLNMNKADGGHRKFILVEMMDYADSITAERVTVLDYVFLSTIMEKADGTVIYADRCSISEGKLAKMGVTFKKIPRDISRL